MFFVLSFVVESSYLSLISLLNGFLKPFVYCRKMSNPHGNRYNFFYYICSIIPILRNLRFLILSLMKSTTNLKEYIYNFSNLTLFIYTFAKYPMHSKFTIQEEIVKPTELMKRILWTNLLNFPHIREKFLPARYFVFNYGISFIGCR